MLHAPAAHGRAYESFLASRPRGAENLAIARLIETARWTGTRTHLLHLSSSDALPMIRTARAEGIRLTVETCPHYLHFTDQDVPAGATEFKCCPPIREAANQELLWNALQEGLIDCVVSDNSPCTVDLKLRDTGDFGAAWGGLAGLQLDLPAVWTGARRRGIPLTDVVRWMAQQPAELAGLDAKGAIAVGRDADLCVLRTGRVVHSRRTTASPPQPDQRLRRAGALRRGAFDLVARRRRSSRTTRSSEIPAARC